MTIQPPISILKSLWSRERDDRWAISDLKGLELKPKPGFGNDYFAIDSDIQLMTQNGGGRNLQELMATFGPTDHLLKQSILPVIAWCDGDESAKCIGTASIISCSGYLITAGHVLMDPLESGYGAARSADGVISWFDKLNFGVLLPVQSVSGYGLIFFPFQQCWCWGSWQSSPLFHVPDRLKYLTDVAICKIEPSPYGGAHQPLHMSTRPFREGEAAYAIGFAEMPDIPITYVDGRARLAKFSWEIYASIGEVVGLFPENHVEPDVPTPGPCFSLKARIPGKMSGAPIFGANGAIIRGVVSRSWSGDNDASGSMLGPAMSLPLNDRNSEHPIIAILAGVRAGRNGADRWRRALTSDDTVGQPLAELPTLQSFKGVPEVLLHLGCKLIPGLCIDLPQCSKLGAAALALGH